MTNLFSSLVFEGGGVKGIAYAGAVDVLESRGIMAGVKRVAGTSAGAVTAALLACGANAESLRRIIVSTPWRSFEDHGRLPFAQIYSLFHDYGWFKGNVLGAWIREQIGSLTGHPDMTFADLKAATDSHSSATSFRNLYVITCNLTDQTPVIFGPDTTPGAAIWKAVRASGSIPLFFVPVGIDGDEHVDGGCVWNYPISLFDEGGTCNPQTLGFRVGSPGGPAPRTIGSLKNYAEALIGFLVDSCNRSHLAAGDWNRTVWIDSGGIGATDFNLTAVQAQTLVAAGEAGAKKYFDWLDSQQAPSGRQGTP